jgi:hypothetical protein
MGGRKGIKKLMLKRVKMRPCMMRAIIGILLMAFLLLVVVCPVGDT